MYAFWYCIRLEKVNFEENSKLTEIGKYAFWDTMLTEVTIPNKCEYTAEGWGRSFPANCVVKK